MTKNNLLNISCIYSDNALAFLFYFLNAVLNKKNNELMHFDRGFTVQFRNNTKDWLDGLSDIEKKERLFNLKEDDLNKTIIHITIDVKEDNADIFSCRYLALIISLLRRTDHVSFHCDRYSFIEKCASYLCLQNIDVPERGIPLKNGKLLKKFSCSTEWFPSIYLSKKNSILYEILSNPIIDNADEMNKALQYHSDQGRTLDLQYIWHENSGLKEKKDQYKACLKECFVKWLNGRLSKVPLQNKLCSISGLSQLLFAIICNRFWAQTTKIISAEEAGKLLDICCDFGDCILQIAENIVSHSEGGVLSIRINDNWDNTDYSLKPKVPGSESQKEIKRNKPWYIRISLVDYSTNSILDNIKKQSGILSLTLSHIFMDQNPYVGMNPEDYQRTAAEYNKYLGRAAQIIHHYGLMVFKSIVDQYNGSFTVKSDSKHHLEDVDMYAPASVSIERVSLDRKAHIYGTEYDVMLPLEKSWLQKPETYNNPSLLLTPKYIVPSMKKMIVFEEDENKPQLFRYFNDRLQRIIQDLFKSKGNQYSYQELKEKVVNQASKELAGLLAKKPISKSVFYFYISEKTQRYFGRAEIIAKVILQTIVELKDKGKIGNRKELLMVLYGFSENKLVLFARQYALFYHRTDGNSKMENCKLFAVSDNYQAEVMFAGIKLSFISDYSRGRRLVTGSSAKISNVLSHIAGREGKIENETDENPPMVFPFELLNRMEIEQSPDKTRVILSKHNKWYHYHLNRILCNDIHKSDLGCQLKNAHIRIGRLHQHSFFEGQLLFANTYWYQVFSHYICEMVLNDNAITEGKSILLYGYETYSEQMLFSAVKKLEDNGRKAYYAVFENPKYITPSETSEQKIRYFDRFLESCTDDICIVYIFGIGTTLTTITDRMYAELQNTLKEKLKSKKKAYLLDTAYQKGIVIIQVSCQTDESIKCDEKTHTVTTTFTNLPFSKNKESNYCHYLIEARTEWHQAEECPDCLKAANYLDELPLMQTNETSTVPMTLIKPWKSFAVSSKFVQEKTYTEDFLHNEENSKYLYYCHLDRSGNHYQFYIRTAALLNDLLLKDYANDASKNPLRDWFDEIRKKELQPIKPSGHEIRINILVSPQHFSNEALVAAINQYVFDGEAYIIHFDVKKEFRSSFVAKFQNYYSAIEMLRKEDLNQSIVLNFYFVDDMIVTGTTFNRAKSLVISMLGNFYPWIHVERKTTEPFISEDRKIHVNLFKGLIILINRNSKESLLNYINPKQLRKNADSVRLLPVYRFIELNTPAIRSYGDSCPICNKLARIKRLESESSLTNVEKHWREKELYHGLKKLSDAATDKIMKNDQTKDPFYKGRGLRRLHCSEMIWSKIDEGLITSENAQEQLEDLINTFLCQKENVKEKVEYLMSFLKIISREHIIYQEAVQPAALKILLRCFSVFIDTETVARNGLYKTIEILIEDESILNDRTKHPYLLYKLIIARLCAMGSIVFCRKEQLLKCIEIGLKLEEDAGGRQGQALDIPAEERFSCFLCIQIKKMLFVTQDYDFRVTVLQNLLSSCINERINLPDAKDDRQLHLLMSLYLEAVSDKTRNGFLQNEPAVLSDQTDKIETFKKKIATDSYDDIMEKFRNMMLAETAIMFQTKNQEDLEKKELNQYKVKEADITVLAQSKEDDNKRIGIIRSELLKFYQKEQYDANRSILMDIDNTARIVKVEANQEDHTVLSYCRTPCTIVYIRIDYIDAVDPKDPKPVFFAFLYPYEKSDCLFWLLRQMQLFLSFRHTLKLRIEKDFIGNLFGKSKAESWRTLWLSIEKAGAHTDSSGISRLIKEHQFEYPYTMKTLLQGREDSGIGSEKDRKYLIRLVYNVYIAMYYRSVISEGDQFISVDNITNDDSIGERYCKVKDLMEFSAKVSSDIEIVFGQEGGERQNAKMINDAELYGEESLPQDNAGSRTSGMTEPKKITFRQKYLQAFIADILCNIERYGEKGSKAEIFIEPSANGPGYLVFRNLVPTGTIPNGKSLQLFCIEKNYSLKQSIEYDNVKSDGAKGISLGCIAHCMRSAGTPGLIVYYSAKDNKVYFTIKLPIIKCSNQPK